MLPRSLQESGARSTEQGSWPAALPTRPLEMREGGLVCWAPRSLAHTLCELVFSFEPLDSGVRPGSRGKAWGGVCLCSTWAGRPVWPQSSLAQLCLLAMQGGSSVLGHVLIAAVWAPCLGFPD